MMMKIVSVILWILHWLEDDQEDYLGEEWQWNNWEEHDIDTEIEDPKEDDHYSGPCGLKSGVSKKFVTVVQCLF